MMCPTALIRELDPTELDSSVLEEAVKVIGNGGVILYPTDTIYGLGCDVFNEEAVKRIYAVKKRRGNSPLLVLTHSISSVESLIEEMPADARRLAEMFWPGPVTLVLRAGKYLPRNITSEDGKIGIRIPKHEFCLRLCEHTGVPIVSTSANISGEREICSIKILKELFTDIVDMIIDGGDCLTSVGSTVIDMTGSNPLVLREGVISLQLIESALKK